MKILPFLFVLYPFGILAQQNNCSQLKDVTLYSYPRNSIDQYKVVRSGRNQVAYNLKTGDSSVYTVKWDKDCRYSLTFVSSSEKKSAAELEVLKTYKFAYNIVAAMPDYYVYTLYLNGVGNTRMEHSHLSTDTAWLKPVTVPGNQELFRALKEKPSYLKKHFNDTSSYAIVYLYRPSRLPAMGANFNVYYDGDFVYPATNGSKIAYKVYKEGRIKLFAKHNYVEAILPLDVQFGHTYYVECAMDNAPPPAKPRLKLREEEKGKMDYEGL